MEIKTAIIGYGRSGSSLHADTIEKLPEFKLSAVCDIDDKALEKASRRFGCNLYNDYLQMLNNEDLDLVVVVTNSHLHCSMTCDCLKSGVNVLVTKPWALNANEAHDMIRTSESSGKLIFPWLPARTAADLTRIKEIVSAGRIGRVFQIRRSEYSFGLRCDWQTSKAFGGGYLLNWGPHLVDQPLQLAESPVVSVYGEMKQINNPGDVEDLFYAVMKTENNITVISEWNIAAGDLPNWIVQGDRGTIIITDNNIKIYEVDLPEKIDENTYRAKIETSNFYEELNVVNNKGINIKYGDPLKVYGNVSEALLNGKGYFISTQSALALTKVLDLIRISSESGKVEYFT